MNVESAIVRAEAKQRAAAAPGVSAFVSAHAGTGKTKLLVDRLLRLMLSGADPARILCLTYTRAGAAEMRIRLQRRLGEWVALDDARLDAELAKLDVPRAAETRARARAIFATVLDLPGGMRIDTIHAFCQSLLRRFPLEASLSPHFRLVEGRDAALALTEAREAVLAGGKLEAVDVLAALVNADGFGGLIADLEARRDRLAPTLALHPDALTAALRRAAGARFASEDAVMQEAVSPPDERALTDCLHRIRAHGSAAAAKKVALLLDWLKQPIPYRPDHFDDWQGGWLTKEGTPRAGNHFVNGPLAAAHPDILPACEAEQARLIELRGQLAALRLADATAALLGLAAPILGRYEAAKTRTGLLDYDDLIRRTEALLRDPHDAAWVLYKLDGGLDHLLLDEVQDTAPAQWRIADALTGDFFAGRGASDSARTVFAVGDRKQSIFSFQGADPDEFEAARARYGGRVRQAEQDWLEDTLDVSFRSTEPVLALVDAVFADPEAARGVCEPGALRHAAHRQGQAGAVELWPLAPRPQARDTEAWQLPATNQRQDSAEQTLVRWVADWIASSLRDGTRLESQDRALRAGDILVLVRRRSGFGTGLVRALKARDVPVAGLDRMVLTDQPAVQDMLSLCAALLLPEDDLAFAEMLVSPFGGLTDDDLLELAPTRAGRLFVALRARAAERPEWQAAWNRYAILLGRVDYAAPHALLAEALGPLGGRARAFARLGPEAAEPLDELLNAALAYAASHPPSLQGFVHWLGQSGEELKREPEAAGGTVRVMTVHGAKGLEAPVVILPDTTSNPTERGKLVWSTDPATEIALPLWAPDKSFISPALQALRDRRTAKALEEYNRLLYVALTRARDRLIVCGWEPRSQPDDTWYRLVARGMSRAGAVTAPFPNGDTGFRLDTPQTAPPERDTRATQAATATLPDWAGSAPDWAPRPPPVEPALPRPLAPSRPEGVEHGAVPASRSPLADTPQRIQRGLITHALLQHLPGLPAHARRKAAETYVRRTAADLPDPAAMVDEILAVLEAPALAPLFAAGSRAEQPVTGVVAGRIVTGQVDRLAVLPDRILLADYKTSRRPPTDPAETPTLYLRQMAAYRALLRGLYPERAIECWLVWTQGPVATVLPEDLLDRYAPGTPA